MGQPHEAGETTSFPHFFAGTSFPKFLRAELVILAMAQIDEQRQQTWGQASGDAFGGGT